MPEQHRECLGGIGVIINNEDASRALGIGSRVWYGVDIPLDAQWGGRLRNA
jgi:hypothetical protein